ncbi:MAG: xylulokinase, partial [Geminicoccaceae bacterium]|nr:xylulokinase [Geminicoccaceae bacterium]
MFLGLDLGTSGVKAVLVDGVGGIVGQATVALEVETPRPLWSEQDPRAWWRATVEAVGALGSEVAHVAAVGVAGQMHGAVLLDEDHRVLRPCILWNDGRSHVECAELEAAVEGFRALSGNLAMPGFTAPKLLWVRRHEPEIFARVRMVLLPKDWLVWHLTGRFTCDMSDAAGTLWLDPAARAWSDPLIEATGLTRAHLPALHEGPEVVGEVTAEAAAALGLAGSSPRAKVVAGAGDNAGGAVGVGVTEPGDGFVSLGTS